jgi:hypothetical protein
MAALAAIVNVLKHADPREQAPAKRRTVACNLLARMAQDPQRAKQLVALHAVDVLMRSLEWEQQQDEDDATVRDDQHDDRDDREEVAGEVEGVAVATLGARIEASKRRADALRALGHLSFELGARTGMNCTYAKSLLRMCAQSQDLDEIHGVVCVLANALMPPVRKPADPGAEDDALPSMAELPGAPAQAHTASPASGSVEVHMDVGSPDVTEDDPLITAVLEMNAIPMLVGLCLNPKLPNLVNGAATMLCNLARHAPARTTLLEAGALPALVDALAMEKARSAAVAALTNLLNTTLDGGDAAHEEEHERNARCFAMLATEQYQHFDQWEDRAVRAAPGVVAPAPAVPAAARSREGNCADDERATFHLLRRCHSLLKESPLDDEVTGDMVLSLSARVGALLTLAEAQATKRGQQLLEDLASERQSDEMRARKLEKARKKKIRSKEKRKASKAQEHARGAGAGVPRPSRPARSARPAMHDAENIAPNTPTMPGGIAKARRGSVGNSGAKLGAKSRFPNASPAPVPTPKTKVAWAAEGMVTPTANVRMKYVTPELGMMTRTYRSNMMAESSAMEEDCELGDAYTMRSYAGPWTG